MTVSTVIVCAEGLHFNTLMYSRTSLIWAAWDQGVPISGDPPPPKKSAYKCNGDYNYKHLKPANSSL